MEQNNNTLSDDMILLYKISNIIDFKNKEMAQKAYVMIENKQPFRSKYKDVLLNRIKKMSYSTSEDLKCLTCKNMASVNGLFCKNCYDKLIKQYDFPIEKRDDDSLTDGNKFGVEKSIGRIGKIKWRIPILIIGIVTLSLFFIILNILNPLFQKKNVESNDLSSIIGYTVNDAIELFDTYKKKKYLLNGKEIPVIETSEGIRYGINENEEIFYVEILENSDNQYNIFNIEVGDDVQKVASTILSYDGFSENEEVERYWANIFLQRGYPDIYILYFSRDLLENDEVENIIVKIYKEHALSISYEVIPY